MAHNTYTRWRKTESEKIVVKYIICVLMMCGALYAQTNVSEKPLVVKTVSVKKTNSLTFVATAYALRGKMANGQRVHSGAIAADPRVLPIGTIVEIDGMGTFTVKDTGGAIKGNRIDIWMSSTKAAMRFGKRKVILKIISKTKQI